MSRNNHSDWNQSKIIDDVEFHEEDAQLFKNLLNRKETGSGEGSVASMSTGQILKGKVVEMTKDFVMRLIFGLKIEQFLGTPKINLSQS